MRLLRTIDFLLNVCLPMLIGGSLYFFPINISIFSAIRNQLPDGLWAYALLSCILIVWKREVNVFWTVAVFGAFLAFEWLQHLQIIPGTGDILDVISYVLFGTIALLTNRFFNSTFNYQS